MLDSIGPDTLILVYNRIFRQKFTVPDGLPPGCAITVDRDCLSQADAVVFHVPSLKDWPASKPPGQLWVAWSMECEDNYPQLRDAEYMRRFDMTMTYRLDADVPAPYADYYGSAPNLARAMRNPPRAKTSAQLAALLISSATDRIGRLPYATEMMRHLDVHSFGSMLNNRQLPGEDTWRPSKLELIADYKFTLAFENAAGQDYVTEKFFDPLVAGSVPVYLGAPNVDQFAPGDRCFINTAAFSGPQAVAEYLLTLHRDDRAYDEYHAWRSRPFRPAFEQYVRDFAEGPFIRLCRAVQARRSTGAARF